MQALKAVIMAGGKGTRLQPFTAFFPKPLMPLGEMPVIEILLKQLRAAGVEEVILAVNHLHYLVRAFCGDGSKFGLKIDYSLEEKPLGTAGPVAAVLEHIGENFIVVNGDLLTNFDIRGMAHEHLSLHPAASIAIYKRELKMDFGLIEIDRDTCLAAYHEKPTHSFLVSMGLYIFNRASVLKHLKPSTYLDMPDLMRLLMTEGQKVSCVQQECVWLDIGRPEDYARAQQLFADQREIFLKE